MTRGEMLGRLVGVGPDAGIGLALRLWKWGLEMSPDGDFSGGAHNPRAIAAAIGWDHANTERLVLELAVVGLIERLSNAGPVPVDAGLVRIRGLERYRRAWEKNNRRKPALRVPVTGTNPPGFRAEPARKTETETDIEETSVEQARPGPVERIFAKYQDAAKSPRSKLDPKRRRLIQARLDAFDEDELIRSLEGYARSPHHHGENDRHTKYLSLELWFRDADHVEAGIAMAAGPPVVATQPALVQTTLAPYPEQFR